MNKARAMLDALMGPGRDEASEGASGEKFKDRSCCKAFLTGMCPLDASLLGGRRKFQVCEKIHSELMKDQLQKHPDCESLSREYERLSLRDLDDFIKACEDHSDQEKQRIRSDPRMKKPPLPLHVNDKAAQIRRESSAMIQKAEALDDDHLQEKEALITRSNEVLKDRDEMLEVETKKAIEAVVPEELCEVCGTTYIGSEANAAHLQFKIHLAYTAIREHVAKLKPRVDEWEKQRKEKKDEESKKKRKEDGDRATEKEKEKEKDKSDGKDRSKEKDKEKEKDKTRCRDRDRDRDKEKDGDRDRDKSRGRDKDKDSTRGRDRDKDHRRGGSRSRDRKRGKSRSRSHGKARRSRSRSRGRRR